LEEVSDYLKRLEAQVDFGLLARTSALRPADPVRLALTAQAAGVAKDLLDKAGKLHPSKFPQGLAINKILERSETSLLLAFSGASLDDSSESEAMGLELFEAFATFRETILNLGQSFRSRMGLDLTEVMFSPNFMTKLPALAEVKIFAYQTAMTAFLTGQGLSATAVMGHGLGEYAAAVAVGLIDLTTGLDLIIKRAEWRPELAGQDLAEPADQARLANYLGYLEGLSYHRLKRPFLSTSTGTFLNSGQVHWPGHFLKLLFEPQHFQEALGQVSQKIILEIGPGQDLSRSRLKTNPSLKWEALRPSTGELWSDLTVLARLWTLGLISQANPSGPINPDILPQLKFHRQALTIPEPIRAKSEPKLGSADPVVQDRPRQLEAQDQPRQLEVEDRPMQLARLQCRELLKVCLAQLSIMSNKEMSTRETSTGETSTKETTIIPTDLS
jgi:acyl transferase domain-containing protein